MLQTIKDFFASPKHKKQLETDLGNLLEQFTDLSKKHEALQDKMDKMTAYDFITSNLFGDKGVSFFDYDGLEVELRRNHQRAVLTWVESNHWKSERDHILSSLHQRILDIDEGNAEGIKTIKELIAFIQGMDERWKLIAAQFRQEAFNDKTEEAFQKQATKEVGVQVPSIDLGN